VAADGGGTLLGDRLVEVRLRGDGRVGLGCGGQSNSSPKDTRKIAPNKNKGMSFELRVLELRV